MPDQIGADAGDLPPVLVVPDRHNRNSPTVRALGPPEETGLWLLNRLRERLGLDSLAHVELLDLGCGVRFTQAILNQRIPIRRYVGVDVEPELIAFLSGAVSDRRFQFRRIDVQHPSYNPNGAPLHDDFVLPVGPRKFDLACMFSVITHQYPSDATALFRTLKRHVRDDGALFFTCFLDDEIQDFEDRSPNRDGGRCVYARARIEQLLRDAGWEHDRPDPPEGVIIGHSYVCRPKRPKAGWRWRPARMRLGRFRSSGR
jgi:SAM-dependent methyltransferase